MKIDFFYITIICLLLSIISILTFYYSQPQYKGRGYCSVTEEYVLPQVYENFVSDNEIEHIIKIAEPKFRESKLVSGFSENVRKSETAWLSKEDPIVSTVIKKVCDITQIPFENAEKIQVVKYGQNGFYSKHFDASCDDKKECVEFEKNGGQRAVTMIIYLNDDFTGGTTEFPNLKQEFSPKKGNALLFYSLQKNGDKCHPLSLHAGTPVKTGHKYIANVWLREKPYKTLR